MPSEKQLGSAFEVSRLTVRQALYELRVEGYVIREKGRGTLSNDLPSSYTLSDKSLNRSNPIEPIAIG
ncbi:GntR family transcriptional regulator [Edaphobacter sp. HDX4]|uniref:GntR family transcriptional regulator n=1 Tax=Edaphobacter sp. HDX4 TaxID=2794064 RepID=UPI003FA5E968